MFYILKVDRKACELRVEREPHCDRRVDLFGVFYDGNHIFYAFHLTTHLSPTKTIITKVCKRFPTST